MPTIQKLGDRQFRVADCQQNHRLSRPDIVDTKLGQLRTDQARKAPACPLHEASQLEICNLPEVTKLGIPEECRGVRLYCLAVISKTWIVIQFCQQTEHTHFLSFHSPISGKVLQNLK